MEGRLPLIGLVRTIDIEKDIVKRISSSIKIKTLLNFIYRPIRNFVKKNFRKIYSNQIVYTLMISKQNTFAYFTATHRVPRLSARNKVGQYSNVFKLIKNLKYLQFIYLK